LSQLLKALCEGKHCFLYKAGIKTSSIPFRTSHDQRRKYNGRLLQENTQQRSQGAHVRGHTEASEVVAVYVIEINEQDVRTANNNKVQNQRKIVNGVLNPIPKELSGVLRVVKLVTKVVTWIGVRNQRPPTLIYSRWMVHRGPRPILQATKYGEPTEWTLTQGKDGLLA